jgi:hypothetical protein
VLQRFYSEYPSDKYEVVAIEKYNKNALPFTLTLGGGLLGGMVGGVIGNHYRVNYVVTYVER